MNQSNGLRVTMEEGEPFRSFRRDHNRDLKSKEEKNDWRSLPAMSPPNGLRSTMGERKPFRSSCRDHNRDLISKREDRREITIEKHDKRGEYVRSFRRDHNRDLKSKEEKIDSR